MGLADSIPQIMKRLLSIDGGGLKGVFALKILQQMEHLLQQEKDDETYLLSDHFHYIGGTSTGAIIAAMISWGMPVREILLEYEKLGDVMFERRIWGRHKSKFQATVISQTLEKIFSEEDGTVSTLESKRLKTLLLVVTRNASTGSPWPITNNPKAKFNDLNSPGCNMKIPLWKLIRASTAAPTFFPPEEVTIYDDADDSEGVECLFEDGGVTPFNNPAYLLYLKATLPEYKLEWEQGEDKLHLVSVGTGYSKLGKQTLKENSLLKAAASIPAALIQSFQQYQDTLCRTKGYCEFGDVIDSELGDLVHASEKGKRAFGYVRYNHTFLKSDYADDPLIADKGINMDDVNCMPFLLKFGERYAQENVKLEHLAI